MRTGTSTTADRQYVWHPYYIDALAISTNSSGTAHYYVQDGNFNVTAAMDSSGAVVERYSTTPYGECIVLNANFTLDSSSGGDGPSDIANEITTAGRRLDVETGLYQYRHRYYHAQLGRFVNRDPIGYADGWNLHQYVRSSPASFFDPLGLLIAAPPPVAVNPYVGTFVIGVGIASIAGKPFWDWWYGPEPWNPVLKPPVPSPGPYPPVTLPIPTPDTEEDCDTKVEYDPEQYDWCVQQAHDDYEKVMEVAPLLKHLWDEALKQDLQDCWDLYGPDSP